MDKHFLPERSPDILIRRDTFPPDEDHDAPFVLVRVNVPRSVIWHSPSGFEFGYTGSGAADLALNILQAFLPGEDVDCAQGTKCSRAAALLHQPFKSDFLSQETGDRIRIKSTTINEWISKELPKHRAALAQAMGGAQEGREAIQSAAGQSLTAAMLPSHPAAPALLYLVKEARKATETTELEILEDFLGKFPNTTVRGHGELVEDLRRLALFTREMVTVTKAQSHDGGILLQSIRDLLSSIETKLGIRVKAENGAG